MPYWFSEVEVKDVIYTLVVIFFELVKLRNCNTSRQNRLLEYGKDVHVSRNSKL
jgi:hypothetical protein